MGFFDIISVGVSLGVVITFIIFIIMDIVNAIRKKVYWIPGEHLVLSAITIQLLSLMTNQSSLIKDDLENADNLKDIIKIDLWMIHSGRVMLCVVVAYLLPGIARRGSENSWFKMLALIIAIFINMTSELYRVRVVSSSYWPERSCKSNSMFVLSAIINFISFTWLILLLGCAYITSKGIEVIISQKCPKLLSSTTPSESKQQSVQDKWQSVQDQVLRCWVFSRAYSLEFIIARSALTSSAATVVALQFLITLVAGLHQNHKLKKLSLIDLLKLAVTGLQCLFIFLGCISIGFRWVTTIIYYKRWQSDTWTSVFRVEDFWTRHIIDLLELKQQLEPKKRLNKRIRKVSYKDPFSIPMSGHLLYLLLGLQWLTALVSKTCWVTSLVIFNNKFIGNLLSLIFSWYDTMVFRKYGEYRKYLDGLGMLHETSESLWIPNRHSIQSAGELIREGNQDAKQNCQHLIELLQRKTPQGSGKRCLDFSQDSNKNNCESQLKYLCKKEPQQLEVEEHFQEASKCSWKMTAVSLISIMVHLSPLYVQIKEKCPTSHVLPPKEVEISLDAYSQAWEMIDLVEKMNQDDDNDGILSQAADKFFTGLKEKVCKRTITGDEFRHENPQCVIAAIKDLAEKSKEKTELRNGHIGWKIFDRLGKAGIKEKSSERGESGHKTEHLGNDSMDWKTVAAGTAVYKLCESIDVESVKIPDDITKLLEEIQSSLADIIYACLDELLNKAVKWSVKCARQSDEKQIARALYTVGKAKKVSKLLEAKREEDQAEKEKAGHQLFRCPLFFFN